MIREIASQKRNYALNHVPDRHNYVPCGTKEVGHCS